MRRTIRSIAVLALAGCTFGFSGGGLPPGIHTVAVLPFDNDTADPSLAQQVNLAVKQAMQSRLGLRNVAETQADAVVHGKIVRYEPDQPLAYQGTASSPGAPARVDVTRRQVELTVDIQVVDSSGRTIWDGRNQVVQGDYSPGQETAGRQKALDELIKKVIDGVHQNW